MKRFIETLKNETNAYFDVIIIGGGITGAAVAYDAALRGLSVALFEKGDFGEATSASTSKLIHGGLRYLATREFNLVRESLKERRILEIIAPNFVHPIPVMLPLYKISVIEKLKLKAGMIIYDLLSYDKNWVKDKSKKLHRHHYISSDETHKKEPCIKTENLDSTFIYYDCINIFPERLTLAFVKSSVKYGAKISNYAKVTNFIFNELNQVIGVRVHDIINNKNQKVHGGIIVNCSGPWVDITMNLMKNRDALHNIKLSEGIHIITKKKCNEHIIVNMTSDGRHIFMIPWRNHTIIGTTDKEYAGNPDNYRITKKSILTLLSDINNTFGFGTVKESDIVYSYGGLRPLVVQKIENSYKSSRKYEIFDHENSGIKGVITVEGGKYTTSRNLAESVVNLIFKKLKKIKVKCKTDKIYLVGCEIPDFQEFKKKLLTENADFDEKIVNYLAENYGTEALKVLDIARENSNYSEKMNNDGEIIAQVIYSIRYELATNLTDMLKRRTGIGTLGDPGIKTIKMAAAAAGKELNWNSFKKFSEIQNFQKNFMKPR